MPAGPENRLVGGARDAPDDSGVRDLHQRRVRRVPELRVRLALAEVSDRAVVDQVERPVGPEPDADRPVDTAEAVREGLLAADVPAPEVGRVLLAGRRAVRVVGLVRRRAVERELLELELQRLTGPAEVHQLDVVSLAGLTVLGREAKVAL